MSAASADLSMLAKDLASAGGNAGQLAAGIVKSTAATVRTVSRSKAPRKTGALAGSIEVGQESALVALIGPHVHYGAYQEFGTGSRGEFSSKSKGRRGNKAQPYMRPALLSALGPMAAKLADTGALVITKGPASTL